MNDWAIAVAAAVGCVQRAAVVQRYSGSMGLLYVLYQPEATVLAALSMCIALCE
jgi:hypothetical protein